MRKIFQDAAAALLLISTNVAAGQAQSAPDISVTSSGANFMVPPTWTVVPHGATVIISPPEPNAHVAIVDVAIARDAADAVASAWKMYRPDQRHAVKVVSPGLSRNGWDERTHVDYNVSADERLDIAADAFRIGARWIVVLTDTDQAVGEKRGAAINLITRSLRPAGYVRESFKGRAAHHLDAERIKQLKAFVDSSAKTLGVPGVAFAVIDHGTVVYEGGTGVRALGKPELVDAHTLFQVASNTKGMSTLLLARQVDAGKVGWDQPVSAAYPAFRLGSDETTKKVLVRQLVCACTGLPRRDYEWIFGSTLTTPASAVFNQLATTKPTSDFGQIYQYNNSMAAAAGYIAGRLVYPKLELGTAYDKAMQTEIFDPLGMTQTTFDIRRALNKDHASPHFSDLDFTPTRSSIGMDYGIVPYRPAGGAWSTAHDMIKYVQLEITEGVLPDGRRLVSAKNLLQRRAFSVSVGEDAYYGMGLMVDTGSGIAVIHHGGTMPGYASEIFAIPDAQVGAVILTNSDEGQLMTRPFLRRLLEILYGGHPEATADVTAAAARVRAQLAAVKPAITVPPDGSVIAGLAHRYHNPDLGTLTVAHTQSGARFDFDAWGSLVASRRNSDGSSSLVLQIPPGINYDFVVGERAGNRILTLRDGQHEYVYVETR